MIQSPSLHITTQPVNGIPLLGDTSAAVFRPLVSSSFQFPIFQQIHYLSHPGVSATKRLISSRFVWSGLASQVAQWTRLVLPTLRFFLLSKSFVFLLSFKKKLN
jgi:hypothetical protein